MSVQRCSYEGKAKSQMYEFREKWWHTTEETTRDLQILVAATPLGARTTPVVVDIYDNGLRPKYTAPNPSARTMPVAKTDDRIPQITRIQAVTSIAPQESNS
jgi:hypothetical protein